MATLRERLRSSPTHVSMRKAWPALIQALRADRRAGMSDSLLHSRGAIERALDTPISDEAQVDGVKAQLSALLTAGEDAERRDIARDIDAAVRALLPRIRQTPVAVTITGWPPGFGADSQALFLGRALDTLSALAPLEAAQLVRDLHSQRLAGHRISVDCSLVDGEALPTVPRDQRGRPRHRGAPSWLPHLDEEAPWSVTPQDLAREHAAALADCPLVIDAFCGCGGDAVAFAEAGLSVIALERNPARAQVARLNARAFGLSDRIDVRVADAAQALPALAAAHPTAGLFLDPPWGGPDAIPDGPGWSDLIAPPIAEAAAAFARVVLKAPRSFDTTTLPPWGQPWHIAYGFRAGMRPPDTVALLRIRSGSRSVG